MSPEISRAGSRPLHPQRSTCGEWAKGLEDIGKLRNSEEDRLEMGRRFRNWETKCEYAIGAREINWEGAGRDGIAEWSSARGIGNREIELVGSTHGI